MKKKERKRKTKTPRQQLRKVRSIIFFIVFFTLFSSGFLATLSLSSPLCTRFSAQINFHQVYKSVLKQNPHFLAHKQFKAQFCCQKQKNKKRMEKQTKVTRAAIWSQVDDPENKIH